MFKNFIEPGRVVYVNFGKDFGKVAVIVDIVDSHRVLIDGPTTGFPRTIYPVKRLGLTSIKVNKILKGARTSTLKYVDSIFNASALIGRLPLLRSSPRSGTLLPSPRNSL